MIKTEVAKIAEAFESIGRKYVNLHKNMIEDANKSDIKKIKDAKADEK